VVNGSQNQKRLLSVHLLPSEWRKRNHMLDNVKTKIIKHYLRKEKDRKENGKNNMAVV